MSMTISLRDQQILRCSSSVYGTLFQNISDIIEEKNMVLDKPLQQIIDKMELCDYGYTMDFEDYVKDKNTMALFLPILSTAIKMFEDHPYGITPATEEKLWNFYHSLEKAVAEEHKLN